MINEEAFSKKKTKIIMKSVNVVIDDYKDVYDIPNDLDSLLLFMMRTMNIYVGKIGDKRSYFSKNRDICSNTGN